MKKTLVFILLTLMVITAFSITEIRIAGWPGNPNEEGAMKEVVKSFNNSNSDIRVVWDPIPGEYKQTLLTRLSAGTAPDIFYVDICYFEELAKKNVLLPLDMYIKKDGYDIDDFYSNLTDSFTYRNRLYGISKDFSTLALYYNKEIFDEYGVEYPTSNDTREDFLRKAQELKNKGYETPLVLAADFNRAIPFIIGNNGKVVNDDYSVAITEKNAFEGFEFYVNLVNKYNVAFEPSSVGSGWIGEAIANSKVAMGMSGPWTAGFIADQYPDMVDKIKVVELPVAKKRASMIYTVSWSINRQSKNRPAAWKVLKYLTSKGQEIFTEKTSILPSRKSLTEAKRTEENKAFFNSVNYGIPWNVKTESGIFAKANDHLNSLLKDLFYNKITIEEAKKTIENEYDSWVKEN